MSTSTMLELSTGHLTADTRAKLIVEHETDELHIPIFEKSDYGWFIFVTDTLSEPDVALGLPQDLAVVLSYARGKGCNWIMFDCDADTIDELPYYEGE